MKKIITMFALVCAIFGLVSCFDESVSTIEIVSVPKLEFNQNEVFTTQNFIDGLSLKVNDVVVTAAEVKQYASISGFDTSKEPGTYSATVSYSSSSVSGTVSFMYTIKVAKETYGFADYDAATKTYYISTVNQFRNIVLGTYDDKGDEDAKFVLQNDLDFENVSPWIGFEDEIKAYNFTGTFDGKGYTIKNLKSDMSIPVKLDNTTNNCAVGMFLLIENATFKNLVFDNCVVGDLINSKGVGLLGAGYFAEIQQSTPKIYKSFTLNISNIKVNNNCLIQGLGNIGGMIGFSVYNLTVTDYEFNGTVKASAGTVTSLVGSNRDAGNDTVDYKVTTSLNNCKNNGILIGSTVCSFFSNSPVGHIDLHFTKCEDNSTVYLLGNTFASIYYANAPKTCDGNQISYTFDQCSYKAKVHKKSTVALADYNNYGLIITNNEYNDIQNISLTNTNGIVSLPDIESAVYYTIAYKGTSYQVWDGSKWVSTGTSFVISSEMYLRNELPESIKAVTFSDTNAVCGLNEDTMVYNNSTSPVNGDKKITSVTLFYYAYDSNGLPIAAVQIDFK